MKKFCVLIMAMILCVSMFACKTENNENSTPSSSPKATASIAATSKATTTPSATATPSATEDASVTADPTEGPTTSPEGGSTIGENAPMYYIDYTSNGWDIEQLTFYNVEPEPVADETGLKVVGGTVDPYCVWLPIIPEMDPTEYNYMALRVKINKAFDGKKGEVRFATENDPRGWALLRFDYADTTEWQTIVLAFSDALMIEPTTLDGSLLTLFRFDPFADEDMSQHPVVPEDYEFIIESVAFFGTAEEALAYNGLYTS